MFCYTLEVVATKLRRKSPTEGREPPANLVRRETRMANRTRPTLEKRNKERARQEKRKQKDERRAYAKVQRSNEPRRPGEEDPDIAGIQPGPQPSPWGDEEI